MEVETKVGMNSIVAVQVAPGVSLEPQLVDLSEKSPLLDTVGLPLKVKIAVPVFVISTSATEIELTWCSPKDRP